MDTLLVLKQFHRENDSHLHVAISAHNHFLKIAYIYVSQSNDIEAVNLNNKLAVRAYQGSEVCLNNVYYNM